jgi:ribosomal protein S18 acetylase RimI-like enzyme
MGKSEEREELGLEQFKIRTGNEDDLAALAALAVELLPGEAEAETRLSVLGQSLMDPNYVLLVADADGKIIGFIDHWVINDFVHGGKLGCIQNLYVSPEYRRKGVGSTLLKEMIKRAKANGVLEIHVSTEFDNKDAIEFYRKQGFPEEHLQLEMEL